MRRRGFLGGLGGAVVAWSVAARGQERVRVRKIGVILVYAEADPEGQVRLSALRDRLRKLGWIEGSNIQVDVRWAAGKSERMRADAVEFVSRPVEVIVANSTPLTGMLRSLTQTIPIVFTQVADPVSSGLVTNYARPTGNITGFTDFDTSIAGKWIEILKQAAPLVSQVTVLVDPKQSNHHVFLNVIETTAASLKISSIGIRGKRSGRNRACHHDVSWPEGSWLDHSAWSREQHTARFNHQIGRSISVAGDLSVQLLRQGGRIAVLRH